MRGLLGWLDPAGGDGESVARSMLQGISPLAQPEANVHLGASWGVAAWAPTADVVREGPLVAATVGRPRFRSQPAVADRPAQELLTLWRNHGVAVPEQIEGAFALALVDSQEQAAFLAADRVGVHSFAFAVGANSIVFADRADAVVGHPGVGRALDPQGLFNYLYFHDIPAPGTVYRGVQKLMPGECLLWRDGGVERSFYWHLRYRDTPRSDFDAQAALFHQTLRDAVGRAAGDDQVAAFLSGGTDSSTVCGVLAEIKRASPRTYSIGFEAEEFDEMEYVRIAAKRFNLDVRDYYLKPDDVLSAIPVISGYYDEPFGNDSAVPVYYCAKLAAEDGYRVMLAGDGGDEIFGGNARYAKQKVFQAYHKLPRWLRQGLVERLASLPALDHLPPIRKLQSYIRQANIPLPERMESYNFIYRQPLEEMFCPEFLDEVDIQLPSVWLKEAYDRADTTNFINRMLHLDVKFTLADNDLRKVSGMTEAAGVEVRYPLLDDAIVEFSGQVPPDWKVRGQYLRWFFRTALKGFLPDEIINKSKHGFGLPFGMWARDYGPLRERVSDRLTDFKRRGLLTSDYIERIRTEHMTGHATYFGKMIWVILMLEEWLATRGL